MKTTVFFLFFMLYSFISFSQNDKEVLFTINKKPFFVSEFKSVYEDNLNLLDDQEQKDVLNNFDLFVNFKLKIQEAYALQLDTTRTYKREINSFRNQLMAPYLQDSVFQSKLLKDAYYRTKYKVKASHILISLPENASPKDTLEAYQKIIKARNEILSGKSFEQVAKEYSDDESAANNGGDLGYFTAFKMVHAFEDVAYATKVGDVSMPFKTNFGYHIIKVFDLKESGGEIEVAHILIADTTEKGKQKIDSVYYKLKNGRDFESLVKQYSNDNGTSKNGGRLPKFGVGMMMPVFENVAFSLTNENDFSSPFLTNYGWHIIKLLKKHPIKPFNEVKEELATKLKSIGGARLSNEALIKKLKKKYTIEINESAKTIFNSPKIREYSNDSLKSFIIKINQKKITQVDFKNYLHNRRHKPVDVLFELFLEESIINYFKENLVNTEPAYAARLKMYEEGLLMFELMNIKVWKKSVEDTLGLQQYFDTNRNKYTFSELSKNKGEVVNDYQTYLETQLLLNLRKKYEVKINNKIVKKLIDFYRKND